MHPLVILGIGVFVVLAMIIVLRINAFLALISAAVIVSMLAPGEFTEKIDRVAAAFGTTAGKIGIVIALAAVIGRCLIESGAADRIVRMFVGLLGEKRCAISLMSSGFVLSIPVFFDTVFYLLLPLARSMHRRTKKSYLLLILAMGAAGSLTHSLVPPTPGPLIIADTLGIDLGMMIMMGIVISLPIAVVMYFFVIFLSGRIEIPMRPLEGAGPEPEPLSDEQLPALWMSILPVVLPVILISGSTFTKVVADAEHAGLLRSGDVRSWPAFCSSLVQAEREPAAAANQIMQRLGDDVQELVRDSAKSRQMDPESQAKVRTELNNLLGDAKLYEAEAYRGVKLGEPAKKLLSKGLNKLSSAEVERFNRLLLEAVFGEQIKGHVWETPRRKVANVAAVLGNANLAMLLSAAIALTVLWRQRRMGGRKLAKLVEGSLMSGGMIILITSAGGAFGAMLKVAEVGDAIQNTFGSGQNLAGIKLLLMAFFVASLLKVAQGSTTVSMITTSAMFAGLVTSGEALGMHPVYVAAAIGCGAQCGNWMNDSGFWVFAKMGGLTEVEALKTWTVTVSTMAVVGLVITVIFASIMPLA